MSMLVSSAKYKQNRVKSQLFCDAIPCPLFRTRLKNGENSP